MTTYRVNVTVEVDGPEWPEGVQVPKRLKDWDQDILEDVVLKAAAALVDTQISATEIEVVFE